MSTKTYEVKWSWKRFCIYKNKQKMKIIDVIFSPHEVCGAEKDSKISLKVLVQDTKGDYKSY
jgi:hypothetical protein